MTHFFKIILFLLMGVTLYSCDDKVEPLKTNTTLKNTTCYFFFIPDCPVCINNFSKIEDIKNKFAPKGLNMKAIYCDVDVDSLQLKQLVKDYMFTIPITIDAELKLAKHYSVTATPQVILVDSLNTILYSGMLDNYFYALGKHRTIISERHLENALESLLKGEEIVVKQTTAIGCRLNYHLLPKN